MAASPDVLSLSPDLINALGRDLGMVGVRGQPLIDLLRRTVDRYPESAWTHWDLANACVRVNPRLLNEALRHAAAAAALVPDSAFFQFRLGDAFEDVRAPNEAIRCYRKTVVLDPQHIAAHSALRGCSRPGGTWPGRRPRCDRWWPGSRTTTRAHYQLGRILAARKKTTEAAAEFRRAVDLLDPLPSYDRYYEDLPLELLKLGQTTDALRLLKRLMELRPAWAANPQYPLRYNAACCAALVSADAKVPSDERVRLRRQAHAWMTATLAAERALLQRDRARLPAGCVPTSVSMAK